MPIAGKRFLRVNIPTPVNPSSNRDVVGSGTVVVVFVNEKLRSLKLNGPLSKSSKLTSVVFGSHSASARA